MFPVAGICKDKKRKFMNTLKNSGTNDGFEALYRVEGSTEVYGEIAAAAGVKPGDLALLLRGLIQYAADPAYRFRIDTFARAIRHVQSLDV